VFDGHCGTGASRWCSSNLHTYFDNLTNFNDDNIINIVIEADKEFCKREDGHNGTTAVIAIIDEPDDDMNREIVIINIGDSRCVIGRQNCDFLCMTVDHKPENQSEEERIRAAGGFVNNNRIEGPFSVSRSLGDSGYKSNEELPVHLQKIIPIPDITRETVSSEDFLLLCCDGIFENGLTSETAIDFIRNYLRISDDPAFVASKLVEEALKLGSKDNLTAVLVQFKDGSSYAREPEFIPGQWYDNGNPTFIQAYKNFSEMCGFTLEEAKAMWENGNKTKKENNNTPPPSTTTKTTKVKKKKKGLLNIKKIDNFSWGSRMTYEILYL